MQTLEYLPWFLSLVHAKNALPNAGYDLELFFLIYAEKLCLETILNKSKPEINHRL